MSLYVYSIWVYRVELSHQAATAAAGGSTAPSRFIDIPFDDSYTMSSTWVQRIATEPRVPLLDGVQFKTEAQDPETHFMFKSIIFRPLTLVPLEQA